MKNKVKLNKKLNSLVYNHIWLKYIVDYGFSLLISVLSAAIFVFGMVTFLEPNVLGEQTASISPMVSGGSSGVSQVIKLIVLQFATIKNERILLSSIYLTINIPLLILAFKGIGKRFGLFTMINVGCVFLFTNLFRGEFFTNMALYVVNQGNLLSRCLFAGTCTGLSSALAYKIDASAGGFDIVSYYISNKKSTLAGKYGIIINGIVITSFGIVNAISGKDLASCLGGVMFSFIYLLTVMLVIDVINIRNKKAQLQIITSNRDLPKLLITNIPHGATCVEAKGAFTDSDRIIIYMVVSTTEIKRAVTIIKQLDPESFVNITALHGVYGNFHTKPIK